MKPFYVIAVLFFLFANLLSANVNNADSLYINADTLSKSRVFSDSKKNRKIKQTIGIDSVEVFKPDPVRVVWMGAIIPGYGQIINRRYWKLPIVYAGFFGCAYAITLNSTRYETYKQAYRDITDANELSTSYLNLLPSGYSLNSYPGGISGLENNLKTFYEQYRRNRDLSIIATIGYYAVVLVEAYVDAQLFDFDISPDLSMHIKPALLKNSYGSTKTLGVQFSLNIK